MTVKRFSFVVGVLVIGAFFVFDGNAVRFVRRLWQPVHNDEEMLIRLGGRDLRRLPA